MKILVLASRFPGTLEKGDKLRLFHTIRTLSLVNDVNLFCVSENAENPKTLLDEIPRLKSCEVVRISPPIRQFKIILSGLFTHKPFQTIWISSSKVRARLRDIYLELKPDIVMCQLVRMAPYGLGLPGPKVLDYMDSFSESMNRRSRVVNFPLNILYRVESKRLKSYEKLMENEYDGLAVISERDASSMQLTKDFSVIPNGVDTHFFLNENTKIPVHKIGFVGNLSYLPNVEAAEFIQSKLCPEFLDCKFIISGAEPINRVMNLSAKNLKIQGWVEDIRDIYQDISIFVAPLFSVTGQQNKILEAMAMSLPCITTSEVNKAIGAQDRKEILIADTAEEFILCIRELLSDLDLKNRLKLNGRKFVEKNYDWDNHGKLFESLLLETLKKYDKK